MTITWKSFVFALLGLAAVAWIGQEDSIARSKFATDEMAATTGDRSCNPHDPFAPCAGATRFSYPAGGGLYFTLDELL